MPIHADKVWPWATKPQSAQRRFCLALFRAVEPPFFVLTSPDILEWYTRAARGKIGKRKDDFRYTLPAYTHIFLGRHPDGLAI